MYSDREADPLDYVHSSLSQGNKVIYYQKDCYRRTISCPVSASSSITNLDSCGKPEGPAASVSVGSSGRSHSSNSVDSGSRQSRALVSDEWEQEDNDEVFEDVTKPSTGAKKFVAALSDVVLDDEAAGKVPSLIEAEMAQPEHKTQWLGPSESDKQLESANTNMPPETEAPRPHDTSTNPLRNKTQWRDTEVSKPLSNKAQWQGAVRSDGEIRPRWSSGIYQPPHKQWQNATKHDVETVTWMTSNPGETGNKPQRRVADTDKTKDWNEVDITTAQSKKPYNNKQATKSNENFSSEPILMKLPKGKLVMTRLSVVEKLSLHYIEDGHVKVLSNVREPDDQNCYLFIPDAKNYPEVLENLLENWSPMVAASTIEPSGLEPMQYGDDHDVQVIKPSRITYSRNQLMTIKLFGNDPDTVPDLPASLKKCT